jgi:transposase
MLFAQDPQPHTSALHEHLRLHLQMQVSDNGEGVAVWQPTRLPSLRAPSSASWVLTPLTVDAPVIDTDSALGVLLTSARQGEISTSPRGARCGGCISWCVRYADGGGLTAAGRQRRKTVRMQAAELLEQNFKPLEVARRLRVSRKSAYRWHQLWRDGGVQALASRGPGGGRCRLSPRCLEKLAGYLEQGPAAHGWVEDQVWTAARVATLIGRKFHVSYSVSGATRLMHRLGFSPQVPARRVAERAEQAVTAWKEATWAEVKEPGRPAEATSAWRTRQVSPGGCPKDASGAAAAARLR